MAVTKLIGRGRLPKQESLKKLNTEQLRKVLHRFGINATEIRNQMLVDFSKTAGRISALKRQGTKADQALMNQLKGNIKRTQTTLERRMTARAISEFQQERTKILYEDDLKKRIWVWVCRFKNSCDSCLPRHNLVKSWNEWERWGMPKSDALICNSNCNCITQRVPELENQIIEYNPSDPSKFRKKKMNKKQVENAKKIMGN